MQASLMMVVLVSPLKGEIFTLFFPDVFQRMRNIGGNKIQVTHSSFKIFSVNMHFNIATQHQYNFFLYVCMWSMTYGIRI